MTTKDDGKKHGPKDDGARKGAAGDAAAKHDTQDTGRGIPAEKPAASPRHRDSTPGRRPRGRPRTVTPDDAPASIPARDEFGNPLRRNGTPVPAIVRKLVDAMLNGRFLRIQVERDLALGVNTFWRWENESGLPDTSQILRLSDHLDASLEYLLDDGQPVQDPYPRRADTPAVRLAEMVRSNGLQLGDIERFLMVIATATELKFQPGQVLRVLLAASKERDAAMSGHAAGHTPGPTGRDNLPSVGEYRAARDAEERGHEGRRNGGPRTG